MTNNVATMRTANSEQRTANSEQRDLCPLITIIIPAYNTGKYIHRAIESSLRQTHNNIEILVIDDGSTDDTLGISRSYAAQDKRVKTFHQANAGVSSARNHGIREAHGEYIIFLDSDDWLEDDAAEFMFNVYTKYPDMCVGCSYYHLSQDKKFSNMFYRKPASTNNDIKTFSIEEAIYNWNDIHFNSACFKIFNASIIRSNNLRFHEGIHYGEDQLFTLGYLSHTNGAVYVDKQLFDIVSRKNSANNTPYFSLKDEDDDSYRLMLDDAKDTPEIKHAMRIYLCGCLTGKVHRYILEGANSEYIRKVQDKAKSYAAQCDYINSEKVSGKAKSSFRKLVLRPAMLARPALLLLFRVKQCIKFPIRPLYFMLRRWGLFGHEIVKY